MCGIWGKVGGTLEEGQACVGRLIHRGPDAQEVWASATHPIVLGHARLAIIDLSPGGRQPMVCDEGKLAIVFNGEVYNFLEVRRELEGLGESFAGGSDTEVVLKAYRRWGPDCLRRFNGMWAMAIFDARPGTGGGQVFLARDRIGKKPLYIRLGDGTFEFASEVKAFTPGPRALDPEALSLYLGLGYVPAPHCLVAGMRKLEPGTWSMLDVERLTLETHRYWDLPAPPAAGARAEEEDLLAKLEHLLLEAVRLRLISDVPLGVFLSGGVDSSLVAAAAARTSPTPIKTFTIAFPGHGRFDESPQARAVAAHLGAIHQELTGPPLSEETVREWSAHVDEPLADASILPTFWVSRLARQAVTVALGGDGGDELFAGYRHYAQAVRYAEAMGWLPAGLLGLAGRLAGVLPPGVRGRDTLLGLRAGPEAFPAQTMPCFDRPSLHGFWRGGAGRLAAEDFLMSQLPAAGDLVARLTRLDLRTYLPDDILAKVDRASMACSLECRSPWLDYRLVEFALGEVPSALKLTPQRSRHLQRRLFERWFPDRFDHSRKQGFAPPLDDLLRASPAALWRELMGPALPLFAPGKVGALWAAHQHGRRNGNRLFALAMLGRAMANLGLPAASAVA